MKVKELIEELQTLDRDKEIKVFDYDRMLNFDIKSIEIDTVVSYNEEENNKKFYSLKQE